MKIYKTLDNGIIIAEYDDSMAAAVADMWNKSHDSWGGSTEIDTAEQVRRSHSGASYLNVYIALKDGEAVGYCSFGRYFKDAGTLYIASLNVRPDYHGKKLGKELVLICVERTIELGYPRLDLFTWPGNTKAVPLYKKCGFFWEDRAETTHLSNFIPTVLSTELLKGFFENASWYGDSARPITVEPDGVKVNKFDMLEYSWEKDGRTLRAGFERTGRRLRLVETDDYKLSLIAENHELAFGLSHKCTFEAVNKTGKPLNVKIAGKGDGAIKFDYKAEADVAGASVFEADFRVSEITEEIDVWRTHPCLLADVYVNGLHAEFGVGIEPKFPLNANIPEQKRLTRAGTTADICINLKSALPKDAEITFTVPENNILKFARSNFSVKIPAGEKSAVTATAEVTGHGFAALPVTYRITLADGRKLEFEKPLYITGYGVGESFSYETDTHYGIVNGGWELVHSKRNNAAEAVRLQSGLNMTVYLIPKLGKPYDDEFNIAKALGARYVKNGDEMMMEVDLASEKHPGVIVTEIYSLSAAGVTSRKHRVTNNSAESKSFMLRDDFYTFAGRKAVFCYEGVISEIRDGLDYAFNATEPEKLGENWIFEDRPGCPCGMYWHPAYKPNTYWGDNLFFEIETGEIAPGGSFETEPVVSVHGLFSNYSDFRNYVLGAQNREIPFTKNHIEVTLNAGNPFVTGDKLNITVENNRARILEGKINVSSDGLFESALQENPGGEVISENVFNAAFTENPAGGVYLVDVALDLAFCKTRNEKAVFYAGKNPSVVQTSEKDGVLTVTNGEITFMADAAFSNGVYSLVENSTGNEWFMSNYPDNGPYSWFNPFLGGVYAGFDEMGMRHVAMEGVTAEFAEAKDSFSNIWKGVRTRYAVKLFDKFKGWTVEQYFLTLPGVPVMCTFAKFINNSGLSERNELFQTAFIKTGENLKDSYCEMTADDKTHFVLRAGTGDIWRNFTNTAKIFSKRAEKMYIFKDAAREDGKNEAGADIKRVNYWSFSKPYIKNGEAYATRPLFFIITEKNLPFEALRDLEKVTFK